MEKSDYLDRVVIRLKKEYGKDELVASLISDIKRKDYEIGVLKSDIDYLNSELSSAISNKEIYKQAKVDARKEQLYLEQLSMCSKNQKEIKELRSLRDTLLSKINELENRIKNLS